LGDLGKKVKVTLLMDEDIVKKGKEIGLNLSKVCENALIEMIERIEFPKNDVTKGNRFAKLEVEGVVGRVGFEPATPAMSRRCHNH
jgi:hypothetical protein